MLDLNSRPDKINQHRIQNNSTLWEKKGQKKSSTTDGSTLLSLVVFIVAAAARERESKVNLDIKKTRLFPARTRARRSSKCFDRHVHPPELSGAKSCWEKNFLLRALERMCLAFEQIRTKSPAAFSVFFPLIGLSSSDSKSFDLSRWPQFYQDAFCPLICFTLSSNRTKETESSIWQILYIRIFHTHTHTQTTHYKVTFVKVDSKTQRETYQRIFITKRKKRVSLYPAKLILNFQLQRKNLWLRKWQQSRQKERKAENQAVPNSRSSCFFFLLNNEGALAGRFYLVKVERTFFHARRYTSVVGSHQRRKKKSNRPWSIVSRHMRPFTGLLRRGGGEKLLGELANCRAFLWWKHIRVYFKSRSRMTLEW